MMMPAGTFSLFVSAFVKQAVHHGHDVIHRHLMLLLSIGLLERERSFIDLPISDHDGDAGAAAP